MISSRPHLLPLASSTSRLVTSSHFQTAVTRLPPNTSPSPSPTRVRTTPISTLPRLSPPASLRFSPLDKTTRHFSSSSRQFQDKMKAILVKDGKGPAESLYIGEEAIPEPQDGQVQVKIKTFGLNRMDILQREGKYPLPPQASKTIMGVEFAGTVSKTGSSASFKVGDEVFGLTYGGAYAEYVVAAESMLLPKPDGLSWVEAAGIPENWLTAYQALFLEGGMKKGQTVLIHAGASGVGVAAIQLALHVGGAAKVFTTCGTDDKVAFLQTLDTSSRLHAINYRTQSFEDEIKSATNGEGVDLIVDFVGRNYFTSNINLLRKDGTLIFLAFLSGPVVESANLGQLLYKRLTIKGSTLRARSEEYQANLLGSFREKALPMIHDGTMSVKVHEVFPWTDVVKAHKEMEANKNSGKIVFEIK